MEDINDLPGIPLGAIVPFAGLVDDPEWLKSQGWMYCNGASLLIKDYPSLALKIGANYGGDADNFNLPDLRGAFLRGCNLGSGNDPDVRTRGPLKPGGNVGDNVGSEQDYATRRPTVPFVTNEDPDHRHRVNHAPTDNGSYYIYGYTNADWNPGARDTRSAGNHTHEFNMDEGGDAESRPINKYVNFLIKYRD